MRAAIEIVRAAPVEWAGAALLGLKAVRAVWRAWRAAAAAERERALESAALSYEERRWGRADPREDARLWLNPPSRW